MEIGETGGLCFKGYLANRGSFYYYTFNKVALESLNKKKNMPGIVYLHPYEIGGKYDKIHNVDFLKNIRYYHNAGIKVRDRLEKMFKSHRFGTHIDFIEQNKLD